MLTYIFGKRNFIVHKSILLLLENMKILYYVEYFVTVKVWDAPNIPKGFVHIQFIKTPFIGER